MSHPAFFYLASFSIGFLLCFPFGAASLEMLRLSLAGKSKSAFFMSAGTGLTCGGYALISLLGVRPILHFLDVSWVKVLIPVVAAVLFSWLAVLAWRDSREVHENLTQLETDTLGMAVQVNKGVFLGLLNPQTIVSWVLALSLLKQAGFSFPKSSSAILLFYISVTFGYETFFILVIQLARRLKFLSRPKFRARLQKLIGIIFAAMAGLCLLASIHIDRF